jgi:gliding motility-associated-like protein
MNFVCPNRVKMRLISKLGKMIFSLSFFLFSFQSIAQVNWTARTSAADMDWYNVTYGNGLFVAIAGLGAGSQVMTSPDGIAWTAQTSPSGSDWYSITYGNGLFVAVAFSGTNQVMTSPDGITWTARTAAAYQWRSVTYGNGLFVAVASSGTGDRVMTSTDGITWTSRASAADNNWGSVTYGNGIFVAVSFDGTNRVMTSPDGITWTARTASVNNAWYGITYGKGLFVATAIEVGPFTSGSGNRVMTSPDGITWTTRTSAEDNTWYNVTYGNGIFVALSYDGANQVMTSTDGITWTADPAAVSNAWNGVIYGNGLFVAVASSGTGNRVMTANAAVSRLTIDAISNQAYTGFALTPSIVVKDDATTLTLGTHYSVAYSNNTNLGTATVTITGMGNYTGTQTETFSIAVPSPTITSFSPASGQVGTLVTITGTNLETPTAFTIGGTAAIVISNTGTSLVGMVMPGAVTGTISLTTAGGSATSTATFTLSPTTAPNTQQGAKLVGTGGVPASTLGFTVSLSADGSTAIVGGASDNSFRGAAWIFTRSGATWSQQGAKLVASDGGNFTGANATKNSRLGFCVSLSADGNTAIVGGYSDNANRGAAWIFTRSGTTWSQQGNKLVGSGAIGFSMQGYAVSISADGNTAIVGGSEDNSNRGAVWIYTRSGTTWTQQGTKLVGTGIIATYARQGSSVSLSADGNTAIVGGISDNGAKGAAWIFTRSGSTWTQQEKLVGTGGNGNGAQGQAVSLSADGNTAIVGAYLDNSAQGAAWIFTRSGTTWTQQGAKLVGTGNTGAARQGRAVSLSADGNTAIVSGSDDNSFKGAAWIYTRNGTTWSQLGDKLVGTGAVGNAYQGHGVSLSADGTTAMVGGGSDDNGKGAVWVYNYVQPPAPTITSFTPTSAVTGATVTITGTNFTGATAVSFGGTAAASFNVVSATSITAVLAAGTSGNVSVTTPGGTTVLAGFTYIPTPVITSFTPTSAATGATVTLTGTDFTGATAVSFGGTAATSFNVVSATSITAVLAAGTTGNVSVTNPDGTGVLAGFTFIPAPVITSFTPTSAGPTATVTLTGTNFTGATAVSFGGTAATSYTVVSSTSITAVLAAGTSGNVSVTTPGGTGELAGFTYIPTPTITSATYNASTGVFVVTGTNLVATAGATNDIDLSKLSLTGEGGSSYTLTTSNVELTNATSFSITLNATDIAAVNQILNKNGTSSTGSTTYNIAAADNWNPAMTGSADLTGNAIEVSNVAVPTITSATYDIVLGSLVVTGTNLLNLSGATNDIDVTKLTFTGQGGSTFTLTSNTTNVEITNGTSFTVSLGATDKTSVNALLNKNGTSSIGGTTYNLTAAEDWNAGADPAEVIADLTGNGITVSNVATITTTGTLAALTTIYATASSNTSFSVSGTSLTNDITVTAPTGFEVSVSTNSGFGNTVTLTQTSGTVSITTVYVRLKSNSTVAGSPYSGDVTCTSTNAQTVNVATVSSTVTALGLTITGVTASNKEYDANTTATLGGTAILVGVETADQANVTLAGTVSATFNNASVGTSKAVTVTGYTLGGTAAGNYTVSQPTGLTANIIAKGLTITGVTANNKEYDANTTATLVGTPTLVGVQTADQANVTLAGTATATFNNASVGTSKTVTVTGYTLGGTAAGNYTVSQPTGLTANIIAKAASTLSIDAIANQTYTGSALTPSLVVKDGATTLTLGIHYSVAYSNNTNVGTATVTITGIGNYTGTKTQTFVIVSRAASTLSIDAISNQTYTGSALTPSLVVKDGATTLTLGTHYSVTYSNNTNVGTASVMITGMGNYTGTKTGTFSIFIPGPSAVVCCSDLAGTYAFDALQSFCGKPPYSGSITLTAVAASPGSYTVSDGSFGAWANCYPDTWGSGNVRINDNCGNLTMSGRDKYGDSYSMTVRSVTPALITFEWRNTYGEFGIVALKSNAGKPWPIPGIIKATSSLTIDAIANQTYTGSALTPAVVVKDGATTLTLGTHYSVAYTNNRNIGIASVTITGKGNYTCTKSQTFSIVDTAPSALSYTTPNVIIKDIAITPLLPTYTGTATSFTVSPTLPAGLGINATTGVISGTLTAQQTGTVVYTITATNTGGSTTATVTLIYNTAPTNITLSSAAVAENAASGTSVATLSATDADAGDTFTFALVSGTGSTDNASFTITGSTLNTAAVFDFETKTSYSVLVRVTDAGGLTFEKAFTISVTNVNEAPTNMSASASSVAENAASGTTVATLSATDIDAGETFTYTLVSGTGDTDNASFAITGSTLSTAGVFDFETKNSYAVRVRVTDAGGLTFERAFTISVTDVNEAPTLTTITDRRVYNVSTSQVVNLSGITAGPETAQSTTTTVTTDKPATFSSINVVGTQIQFTLATGIVTPQDVVVSVRVKDNGGVANGGVDTLVRTFKLGIDPMPVAAASPNLITLGTTAQLNATGANAVNYTWVAVGGTGIVGSGTTINVRPAGTTTYAVVVTNSFGYQATIPLLLTVIVDYKLVPNNLVTPNGDGVNDKWVIPNIDMYPNNEVMVYDKAGRVVYTKRGYNNEWDGTLNGTKLKEDAYFFVIKFNKDGVLPIRGYVSIVR